MSQLLGKNACLVKTLRLENPKLKAIRISEMLGISKERVRQILVKLDLPTRFPSIPADPTLCIDCGKRITPQKMRCRACLREYRKKTLSTYISCSWCGKQMRVLNSILKRNIYFTTCSRDHWYKFRKGKVFKNGKMKIIG